MDEITADEARQIAESINAGDHTAEYVGAILGMVRKQAVLGSQSLLITYAPPDRSFPDDQTRDQIHDELIRRGFSVQGLGNMLSVKW